MSHTVRSKKKFIPVLILVLGVALIAYFYGTGRHTYTGVVEATILPHTAEAAGKILEMPVELGQHVSKGDLIAKIDDGDQRYAYDQLKLTLEKKRLALSELEVGQGGTQAENGISIAQSAYNSAASASQKAALDYQNALALYNQGAIPKDALDLARVKADSAANALTAAKAQLDNARNGSSAEAARLDLQQTELQLAEMEKALEKFTIRAEKDGVIMSKSYVLGDMVAPGYSLADVAADDEKYFVFYLPVSELSNLEYDQVLQVENGGAAYASAVRYIDVESEYTPKDMQTAANKNKESVKIKLLLPKDCPLKPGQEARVGLSAGN